MTFSIRCPTLTHGAVGGGGGLQPVIGTFPDHTHLPF